MQPMSEAGTGKPASSAESNGASKELKSEGVGEVQSNPAASSVYPSCPPAGGLYYHGLLYIHNVMVT